METFSLPLRRLLFYDGARSFQKRPYCAWAQAERRRVGTEMETVILSYNISQEGWLNEKLITFPSAAAKASGLSVGSAANV